MVVKVRNMKLTKEMIVEVRTTEDGLKSAWFEEVIIDVINVFNVFIYIECMY
jgi:hypothetical protein